MKHFSIILFCLIWAFFNISLSASVDITQHPYAIAYTPNSVLNNPPPLVDIRFAGVKPRYSTCGGVCWFQGNQYVFAVNMQTSTVQVYKFKEEKGSLEPVKGFSNADGIDLERPEGLSISKDQKFLVIPNMRSGKVNIYKIDPTKFFNPQPLTSVQGFKVHGAQFTPDGQYMAYAGLSENSKICVFRMVPNEANGIDLIPTQVMPNMFEPLRPKSIDFSHNGQYAVVGYCVQLSRQVGAAVGIVVTYHFDPVQGIIDPTPISYVNNLFSTETVAFYPDSSCFFAVDQVNNCVTGHEFDIKTGKIGRTWIALQNPEAQLNFPHGIAFSSDGNWVAVSNYGDDKVTIYKVNRN